MHQDLTQRWNRNYQKCPKKGAGSFGEIYKMIQKPQKWPFIWSSRCLRDAVEIFRFLLNQKTPFHTVIQMNSKMLILFYSMSVMTYTEVFQIENAFNGTYPYRIVKIWSHFGIYLEQCVKVGCYSLGLKSWVV